MLCARFRLMLGVFLIALGSTAVAQDFPKAEVFGGYSYSGAPATRTSTGGTDSLPST